MALGLPGWKAGAAVVAYSKIVDKLLPLSRRSVYQRIKICPEHGEMKWGKEDGRWVAHNWGFDYKQGRCVAADTRGEESRRPQEIVVSRVPLITEFEEECGWTP